MGSDSVDLRADIQITEVQNEAFSSDFIKLCFCYCFLSS